jgi:putative heme-binding domain-containing protein
MARCLCFLLLTFAVHAAEPALTNATVATNTVVSTNATASTKTNLPPEPALPPQDPTYPTVNLPGFRTQLAAAAPLIAEPVALAFDAAGRLFVAERLGGGHGRLSVLHDADGNGTYERLGIWADDLPPPTALVCYGGGAFLAAGNDILFLKGSTNATHAEQRRVVFSGFRTNGSTPAQMLWASDHRIHVVVPGSVELQTVATGGGPVRLAGNDFAFDPRTLAVTPEPGGGHHAVAFDRQGRRFTSSLNQPLRLTMASPEVASRNPYVVWPELLASIVTEPRTNPFSLMIYGGGVLPTNFTGNVFSADPAFGVVRRLVLRENGLVPTLTAPPGQKDSVFISATDPSFRPIQVISGPDGALFVADLMREDLSAGGNSGRIWRIAPSTARPQRPTNLDALNVPALGGLLASPNGWTRETAARLLFERRDPNTAPVLRRELLFGRSATARLTALQAMHGLETLSLEELLTALRDEDLTIRQCAIQFAAPLVSEGRASDALWNSLIARSNDGSPRVRYALALALGGSPRGNTVPALANLLRADRDVRWMQLAVLTGARNRADALFTELLGDARFRRTDTGWALLITLAEQAGYQDPSNGDAVLLAIEDAKLNTEDTFALASAMGRGLRNSGRNFVAASPQGTWRRFANAALEVGVSNQSVADRAAAIRYLGVSGFTAQEVADWALALLVPGEPQAVQSAAIETLTRFDDPVITTAYLQRWSQLTDTSRREMMNALLRRPDRTFALMNAFEARRIPLTALTPIQANFLRTHFDATTATRARRLLGSELNGRAGLNERFAPAVLKLSGYAPRGRTVFQNRCASCHRANGEGRAFGPDLDNITRSREELLSDILEPNRRITSTHQTHIVQRTNGDFLVGLVQESGPNTLLLMSADGSTTFVPRAQINHTLPQDWSLMPEEAAAGLTTAQLADLLTFLLERKQAAR